MMKPAEMLSREPATGDVLWRGESGDVDGAVSAARAAAPGWTGRPLAERIAFAAAFRDEIGKRAEPFAELIARETGKPLWESRTEVASVAAKVEISIAAQAERAGERQADVEGGRQAVRHKPHGVVAVLGPYNFPAHLPNGHVVPALLAGNTVVFKPSEQTPAVAEYMVGRWRAAGLPDGVVNLVQGGAETGRALAGHEGIDGLFFTGAEATGLALHRQFAAAPQKILALEMGGNNPLVVWDVGEADREAAAALIVQSAFISAGQRCTCARRLIVRDDNDALLEAVRALTDRIIVGAPLDDPQPYLGPLIDNRAADRLLQAFDALIGVGARAIQPLRRTTPGLPFVAPGIVDVTGLAIPDEEHFGPLLQVIRVPDFNAAVKTANSTRFGLAAGLIGGDRALYERFWRDSRAGIVNWNRPTTGAASNAPFGGVGLSGNHRPSAYYAADYCAWPVSSIEADTIAGAIPLGIQAPGAVELQ